MTIIDRPTAIASDAAHTATDDTKTDDTKTDDTVTAVTATEDTLAADKNALDAASPMRVRKRNGDLEPVDVNKIVRAVAALRRAASTGVDPMRVATRTISGLARRRHHRRSSTSCRIRTAAALVSEEPNYSRLAGPPAAPRTSRRRCSNQDIHSFSPVDRRSATASASSPTTTAELVAANARKLNDAIEPDQRPAVRVLRPAHGLRPLPAAPPRATRSVIETPQYFFMRVACGLSHDAPTRRSSFYRLISSLEYLPSTPDAVQLRHRRTRRCRRCYLLDSPEDDARRHLRPLHRRRPALEVRRRHRPRLPPRALAGLAHPRHQRPVQRHRAVAQDARLARSRPSTRAASARARRASTSRRGTPTSRSSSSCATTPATRPAAPTTSTSPTGCPTCSWSGSRRTGCGRCSTPRRCRTSPTSTATSSSGPTSRPRPPGALRAPGARPASSTAG